MLSMMCAEKDLEEGNATASGKWMTTVVVHMQPIAPSTSESPAANPVLDEFERIVRKIMDDHEATTKALGRDTLASVFRSVDDNVQDAWQGIQAAFAVMERLGDENGRRKSHNRFPIRVGIGVHSGPTPPGTRAEYISALTQNVSKAEELSILNRQTPFPAIFITKNTLKRLDGGPGYHVQPLGEAPSNDQGEWMPVYAMMHAWQPA